MSTIWLKVSRDKYELPEVVAGSIQELAWRCGVKTTSIYSSISHYKKEGWRPKYVKVDVEEDDNELN